MKPPKRFVLQKPVLVEDAGLIFAAMGRLPGTYIKWFIEEIGLDGLVCMADGLPERTALGRVCYGLYDGSDIHFFDGEMRGSIATEVHHGGRGFGFDGIFINDGFSKTRSEMTEEEYDQTSYRTGGLAKLRDFLTKQ
jgi:non-canonical purine NTP pyrophosphatase (RdgB/HAM1 family)